MSSKSIPISPRQHSSSNTSPSLIPTNNAAAHMIMEVAPSPKATTPLTTHLKAKAEEAAKRLLPNKGSSVGPSAVSNVKDKEKAILKSSKLTETCQRPVGSNAAKYLKGKSLNKSWNGPDAHSFNVLSDTRGRSADLNNMGKSVSLAIQAKLNVQKRLARNSSGDGSFDGHEVQGEVVPCQSSIHEKCPTDYASGVLTPSISVSPRRRQISSDSSSGQHTSSDDVPGNSKTGCRKKGMESTYDGKKVMYSNTKNVPRKKHIIDEGAQSDKNCKGNFYLNEECEQRNKSNLLGDSHREKKIDAVSFSVTAPMKGSVSGSKYCNQVSQETKEHCMGHRCKRAHFDSDRAKLSSSLGLSVNIKDSLKNLLEQNLRGVTNGVEFRGVGYLGSNSATSYSSPIQLTSPSINGPSNSSNLYDKLCSDGVGSQMSSDFSSDGSLKLRRRLKYEAMEYQHSPVSILEPAFSTESCTSSDSYYSNITEGTLGSNECSSSLQAEEALGLDRLKKSYSVEPDTDLSDSASSAPITTLTTNHTYKLGVKRSTGSSTNWELEYVKKMLSNMELKFNNFALGRETEIISPHLYYQMKNREGVSWPMRKELFDCVGECLDIRCKRYIGGGFKSWAKGKIMVRRNERLAEELCKDIFKWEKMGDCMVDELVGEEMSNRYGRWAGFEAETFQIGVEIQERIFYSLVTEVVCDILRR